MSNNMDMQRAPAPTQEYSCADDELIDEGADHECDLDRPRQAVPGNRLDPQEDLMVGTSNACIDPASLRANLLV